MFPDEARKPTSELVQVWHSHSTCNTRLDIDASVCLPATLFAFPSVHDLPAARHPSLSRYVRNSLRILGKRRSMGSRMGGKSF